MRFTRLLSRLAAGAAVATAAAAYFTPAPAADHRDGPIFSTTTPTNSARDVNDMYIFQAPGNPNNTVLIMDVQPFPGNLTNVFFDPALTFDLRVDNTGDAIEDIVIRVNFGRPDANGVQDVTFRGLPATRFPAAPGGVLARGRTGQNLPVAGGGMARAGMADDPFFFDAGQFGRFAAAAAAPRCGTPGSTFSARTATRWP